ncbi:MAG: efflux RND transporter periplasmic adaptor subunit [bacterium]|nr:efflux RND transporter periplasmic adaptor subunit [bacterium]
MQRNITMVVVALALAGAGLWFLMPGRPTTETGESNPLNTNEGMLPSSQRVQLSDAKAAEAAIVTQEVTQQSLQVTRSLPARFAYDERHHVAVRAATVCLMESIAVKPGDVVEAGQEIASLRCPDIGEARSSVLQREEELSIAEREREWWQSINEGVEKLTSMIQASAPIADIELAAAKAMLGEYEEKLLSAYSQFQLAESMLDSAARSSGAVSGVVLQQRTSELQRAKAVLGAAVEKSIFETSQRRRQAELEADTAKRKLLLARQSLATLVGIFGSDVAGALQPTATNDLALVSLKSPISGTIEELAVAAAERIESGAKIFVIADTNTLWVRADIRGRDWQAMSLSNGSPVQVYVPADDNRVLDGIVQYVGREVDPESGALSLVVEVENRYHNYRPGLFARVEVPSQVIDDAIVIPDSALFTIDNSDYVFVQDGEAYVARRVQIGLQSRDKVQILSGLQVGEKVVTEGGFVLKSELLLEAEE